MALAKESLLSRNCPAASQTGQLTRVPHGIGTWGENISFPEFPPGFVLILLSHLTSCFVTAERKEVYYTVRVLPESHIANSLFLQIENMQRGILVALDENSKEDIGIQ